MVSVDLPVELRVAEKLLGLSHPSLIHIAASRLVPALQVNKVGREHPAVLTLQLKVVD